MPKPLPYSPIAFYLWLISSGNSDLSDKTKFVADHFTRDSIETNGQSKKVVPLQSDINKLVEFFSEQENFDALQSARALYTRMSQGTLWSTDCALTAENVWRIADLDRITLKVEARDASEAEKLK